jgi:hypothetical protein
MWEHQRRSLTPDGHHEVGPRHGLIVAWRALSPSTPSPQAQPSALRLCGWGVDRSARPKQRGCHAVVRDSAATSRHKIALDSWGPHISFCRETHVSAEKWEFISRIRLLFFLTRTCAHCRIDK